ncbi:MAG: sigma-70 family RNA polymerase sigma factor [Bacteroidota bacterium]|nr:sigma-70 family RNA polymerase sigma factor [Bacteroidota bacterium]
MTQTAQKEKFVKLINNNKGILYKIISIYCKDLEDRKDLEQEILIQLWKSMPFYNDQYKVSTWIYRIALNVSISFYRKGIKIKKTNTSLTESIFQITEDEGHAEELSKKSLQLQKFIDQLDDFNKAIIILYLEDKSYKEIAEIIGISETNVGTKLNRIKAKLKEYFSLVNN